MMRSASRFVVPDLLAQPINLDESNQQVQIFASAKLMA